MKKYFKILLNLASLPLVASTAIACASYELKYDKDKEFAKLQATKTLKNWGDESFAKSVRTNNLTNLSYKDEANNVQSIAPFNKEAKRSNVMYQLTVYSFADGNNDGIGDFIGLKNNLDYFANLGIDTLYLSPIHPASSYHGYDVIDYTDVAPELGGMAAFDEFLTQAHAKGIRVVIDMVLNHTSYEHPWFQKALQGDPKYMKYYYMYPKTSSGGQKEGTDDIRHLYKVVNTPGSNPPQSQYKWAAEFWSGMPDLNLQNQEVIDEIKSIHKFWAKKGIDGFRYDAFYHFFESANIYKGNNLKGYEVQLFSQFRKVANEEYIKAQNNNISRSSLEAFMFGEWWDDSSNQNSQKNWFNNRDEISLSSLIDGSRWKNSTSVELNTYEEIQMIKRFTDKNGVIREWIPFLDNHDVERWISKIKSGLGESQVTNEPHKLTDKERAKYLAALFSLLSRGGLPTLYNGNEILMQGGPKTRDVNVREAFWWEDTTKNVDFYELKSPDDRISPKASPGEGSVEAIIKNPNSSYNLVSKLINLRKEYISMREMNEKYIVENPTTILNFSTSQNDFKTTNTTLRNNNDGTYLLILYSDSIEGTSKISLEANYQVKEKLFGDNFSHTTSNNKTTISASGKLKFGAYLIEAK
ncbi:alpha-amylase [Mycoplasmopsis bovirhinis]|uniref:alpha-amylase family glycosyl hydrolase n=1 Tax=Mycoplasmopsis bovirhinis TaxID=29553 RepID=UPI000BB9C88C|nr:alpha-amylase family glycosyl hydrolase [Mycoplasmopsis bovirhinis]BBA22287.1 alpha-amylase [Mycoplasmopsis bovirhinis]